MPDTPQESAAVGLWDRSGPSITNSEITILSLAINNPLADATVHANGDGGFSSLTLFGPLHNDGTVSIAPNGPDDTAILEFAESTAITGAGRLQMTRETVAYLSTSPGATVTNGPDHTIWGSGRITAQLINEGTIEGHGGIDLLGFDKINNALIFTRTGCISIHGITIRQGNSGVIRTEQGVVCVGEGVTAHIAGGTIETIESQANLQIDGVLTLDAVVLNAATSVRPGGTLSIASGGASSYGVMTIGGTESQPSQIRFDDDASIDGVGEVWLRDPGSRSVLTTADGALGTIGSGQRIIGEGQLGGCLLLGGAIAPGPDTRPTDLHIEGELIMQPTAVYEVDIGGNNGSDRLTGNGSCTLDGTLRIHRGNNPPGPGAEFQIVQTAAVAGRFHAIDAEPLSAGRGWRLLYEPTQVLLRVVCMGDFNADGETNTRDVLDFLNAWVTNDPAADVNNDGVINTRDVLDFLNAWTVPC